MKTLLSIGVSTAVLLTMVPSSWADTTKKVIRNDRISINHPIQQYDINPFYDQQRVVRNDRVSVILSTVEKPSEQKKRRIIRNDCVSVIR